MPEHPNAAASSSETRFARICDVETRYDLLQYQVPGWCVWPLLRLQAAGLLANLGMVPRNDPRWGRAKRLALALRDSARLLALRPQRHVVKTYSSGLLEQVGGRYKDIWVDDLLMEVGSYVKIEAVNNSALAPRRRAALIAADLTAATLDLMAAGVMRVGRLADLPDVARVPIACMARELGRAVATPDWGQPAAVLLLEIIEHYLKTGPVENMSSELRDAALGGGT